MLICPKNVNKIHMNASKCRRCNTDHIKGNGVFVSAFSRVQILLQGLFCSQLSMQTAVSVSAHSSSLLPAFYTDLLQFIFLLGMYMKHRNVLNHQMHNLKNKEAFLLFPWWIIELAVFSPAASVLDFQLALFPPNSFSYLYQVNPVMVNHVHFCLRKNTYDKFIS